MPDTARPPAATVLGGLADAVPHLVWVAGSGRRRS